MPSPIVLLDCDGILADFVTAALGVIHELTGEQIPHERITTWEIFESIGDDSLRKRVYEIMNSPGFSEHKVAPYPGAKSAIAALQARSDLYIVTSPFHSAAWMHGRLQWLDRELAIPHHRVIFAREKHVVRGDLFVDDSPAHVRAWNGHWRACAGRGLLFDQWYNRADTDLPRIRDLSALVDHVQTMGIP